MPRTYPLALSEFQDLFNLQFARFIPDGAKEVTRDGNGKQFSASVGDVIWKGKFRIPPTNDRSLAHKIDTLLSLAHRSGSSVLLYDPSKTHPADDPDGSILGASTPQISSLDATDARLMAISGLPANYQLRFGDHIGIVQSGLYMLHSVAEDVQANGSGVTPLLEVDPFVRDELNTGSPVTLIKPVIKAVISATPDYGSHRAVVSSSKAFQFVQDTD